MTTLYEIADEYRSAIEGVSEDGEVDDDLEERLDDIAVDFASKVDAVAKARANALAEAAALKAEAARLTDRRRVAEAQAARLLDYLGACLRVMGERKVKTSTHTVSWRKTPARVVLGCEPEELPVEWQRVTIAADLGAIKTAIQEGAECAAIAHLETGERVSVR